jgi:hypothetical protein
MPGKSKENSNGILPDESGKTIPKKSGSVSENEVSLKIAGMIFIQICIKAVCRKKPQPFQTLLNNGFSTVYF